VGVIDRGGGRKNRRRRGKATCCAKGKETSHELIPVLGNLDEVGRRNCPVKERKTVSITRTARGTRGERNMALNRGSQR